jgi:hypothetical protein
MAMGFALAMIGFLEETEVEEAVEGEGGDSCG